MHERAQAIGQRIAAEDDIGTGVAILDRAFGQS